MALVFNKSHYNSGEGMLTSVWGPALWHVLHTISFNYPVKPSTSTKKRLQEIYPFIGESFTMYVLPRQLFKKL